MNTELKIGEVLTIDNLRLKVVKLLARGGMGSIYLCKDELANTLYVVKTPRLTDNVSENESLKGRIGVEYDILKKLSHENIIKAIAFTYNPQPYLVLEYFPAPNAYTEFQRRKIVNENELMVIAKQLLDAASYIHALNIVHRDINPKNVLVSETLKIKLIDFGTAKHFYTQQLKEGDPVWPVTLGFTAPEQERYGFSSPLSDIYSIGATLYYIASGKNPREVLDGDTPKPITKINPAISQRLSEVINTAMNPNPNLRFKSATEFLQHLVGATILEIQQPYLLIGEEKVPITNPIEIGRTHSPCNKCGRYRYARRINITDPSSFVSRHHLLVYPKGGYIYVEFIGSVNNAHIIYYDPTSNKPIVKKLETNRPWILNNDDIIALCYHEKLGPYFMIRFIDPRRMTST
jgi:serine/threonine protein kinase